MQLTNRRVRLMGTVIDVSIYHKEPEPLLDQVEALLHTYNKRFSANDNSSELMKINKAAGLHPVTVHPELFELISLGKWHSCQPGSHLNIAIGSLIQTWRIGFSDAKLPLPEEIRPLLDIINPDAIVLSEKNQSVFLKEKGMKIDLGALAKGFSADLLASYLRSQGIKQALIDLGGNILTLGLNPVSHRPWRIGIQNPQLPRGEHLLVLSVTDKSVVTSGTYVRHLDVDGQSFHHIFDPQTGYPVETELASLTIISDRSVDGEIWTTRLFGEEPTDILKIVETLPGIDAILVYQSGRLAYTSGLHDYL